MDDDDTVDNYAIGTTTIPYSSFSYNNMNSGSVLISNGNTPAWSAITTSPSSNSIDVKGDANFEGDIKWKGQSLSKMIESINDRLAILQPDPAKLEKYEALKKAYDHYKLLEKLIGDE